MASIVLLTSLFALAVGAVVFWGNPNRFTNQAFTLVSLILSAWLLLVRQAILNEEPPLAAVNALPWLRANAAVAAFAPWAVWLLQQSLVAPTEKRPQTLRDSVPWLLVGVLLAVLSYVDGFVFVSDNIQHRGAPYWIYSLVGFLSYLYIVYLMLLKTRGNKGIQRLEIQFLVLNVGLAALIAVALTSIGNFLHVTSIRRASFFVFLIAWALTAWGITYHRIFDVKHVFFSISQRTSLMGLFIISVVFLTERISTNVDRWIPLVVVSIILSPLFFWIDRATREQLGLTGEKQLANLRTKIIETARTEPEGSMLISHIEHILCDHFQTPIACLLFEEGHCFSSREISIQSRSPLLNTICIDGWATPESLQRRRPTPELETLRRFLLSHAAGAVVASPRGSPSPSLLIILGSRVSEWPFTYPEVRRIQSAAELIDNILTRSRLTAQAALKAKLDHMAMMSRGLAHDFTNLITPISSFLIHTEGHFSASSIEEDVRHSAKRSIDVIRDYVSDALFFAKRFELKCARFSLLDVSKSVGDLMQMRAKQRGVSLKFRIDADVEIFADPTLIKRVLVNLVANAIDASLPGSTVLVSGANLESAWTQIRVIDQGTGIDPANLDRIFDPYFTTKKFGEEVRGFGLGLTICQKIVHLHDGSIRAESTTGGGTTMTVEIPTSQRPGQQSSTERVAAADTS